MGNGVEGDAVSMAVEAARKARWANRAAERVRECVAPEFGRAIEVFPVDHSRVELRLRIEEGSAKILLRHLFGLGPVVANTSKDTEA